MSLCYTDIHVSVLFQPWYRSFNWYRSLNWFKHPYMFPGNRTYVGYLYTEVTYNNSVVRVFVQLLQDTVVRKRRVSRGGVLISRGTNIVSSPTLNQGG